MYINTKNVVKRWFAQAIHNDDFLIILHGEFDLLALLPVILLSSVAVLWKDKMKADTITTYFVLLMSCLNVIYFASLVNLLKPVTILVYIVLFAGLIAGAARCKKNQINPVSSLKNDIFMNFNNIEYTVGI